MRKERLTVGFRIPAANGGCLRFCHLFCGSGRELTCRIIEERSRTSGAAAGQGRIDLAIIVTLPITTAGLDYEVIYEEQLLLLASPKSSIFADMDLSQVDLSRKQLHYLRPERLENQPYIAYSVDQGLHRTASQLFERFSVRHARYWRYPTHPPLAHWLRTTWGLF